MEATLPMETICLESQKKIENVDANDVVIKEQPRKKRRENDSPILLTPETFDDSIHPGCCSSCCITEKPHEEPDSVNHDDCCDCADGSLFCCFGGNCCDCNCCDNCDNCCTDLDCSGCDCDISG